MFQDLNQQRSRARHLRERLRELLDDADSGRICLTQNAAALAVLAEQLREVENAIHDQLLALAAGV